METNSKISAKSVLNSLGSLSHKAIYLQELNYTVKALLDAQLAKHCHVANVRHQILILHLDAAEWATALHYQTSALLEQLRQQKPYNFIKNIQYKVRPVINERKRIAPFTAIPLSSSTRKLLNDAARCINNRELAAVLNRLSTR